MFVVSRKENMCFLLEIVYKLIGVFNPFELAITLNRQQHKEDQKEDLVRKGQIGVYLS